LALPKFQSKILYWNTTKFSDTGDISVYFITEYSKDANRKNDTAIRSIRVFKLLDVGIDSIQNPKANNYYDLGSTITIQYGLFNDGAIKAWQVPIKCKIYDQSGKQVFNDSVKYDIEMYSRYTLYWLKKFTPKSKGIYRMVISASDALDKFKYNDSLVRLFVVGRPYDIALKAILQPKNNDTLKVGYGYFTPSITLQNNGLNKSTFPLSIQIFYEGFKVHFEIINKTMDTGIIENYSFPTNFSPPYTGKYQIVYISNLSGDVYRKNDTLRAEFFGEIGKDAYPHGISVNDGWKNFDVTDSLKLLKVHYTNQGKDSMKNIKCLVQGFFNGNLSFEQKSNITLAANSVDSIDYNLQIGFGKTGTLLVRSITISGTDQNHKNDTTFEYFDVQYNKDVAIIKIENPGTSNIPDTTTTWHPVVWCSNLGLKDSSKTSELHYVIYSLDSSKEINHWVKPLNSILSGDTIQIGYDSFQIKHAGCYSLQVFIGKAVDGNAKNDTFKLLYCIEKNNIKNLKREVGINPNPADQYFSIQQMFHTPYRICLRDYTGKIVRNIQPTTDVIFTDGLSNGVYILTIESEQGLISRKVIIQH